jgi:hypothetical protein
MKHGIYFIELSEDNSYYCVWFNDIHLGQVGSYSYALKIFNEGA